MELQGSRWQLWENYLRPDLPINLCMQAGHLQHMHIAGVHNEVLALAAVEVRYTASIWHELWQLGSVQN